MKIRYKTNHKITKDVAAFNTSIGETVFYDDSNWEPVPEKSWHLITTLNLPDGCRARVVGDRQIIIEEIR